MERIRGEVEYDGMLVHERFSPVKEVSLPIAGKVLKHFRTIDNI